jgi:hypothetical protein
MTDLEEHGGNKLKAVLEQSDKYFNKVAAHCANVHEQVAATKARYIQQRREQGKVPYDPFKAADERELRAKRRERGLAELMYQVPTPLHQNAAQPGAPGVAAPAAGGMFGPATVAPAAGGLFGGGGFGTPAATPFGAGAAGNA